MFKTAIRLKLPLKAKDKINYRNFSEDCLQHLDLYATISEKQGHENGDAHFFFHHHYLQLAKSLAVAVPSCLDM
ncbi:MULTISPECIES: hypothetical protein [Pseudovibrio]|uniref:hypothetical protein n=1 Tax=Stappiaceae TaxID=2821832 RepID=UPI002366796B|nr:MULTISPECIES: hypothetical protein [Pseudovibrio]MDD7908964.1 hypothetical protein [Pseudovibrio exalbescens]MDX5593715.1 hypothetical protein [Pseudovibrio sp. SPO723]